MYFTKFENIKSPCHMIKNFLFISRCVDVEINDLYQVREVITRVFIDIIKRVGAGYKGE